MDFLRNKLSRVREGGRLALKQTVHKLQPARQKRALLVAGCQRSGTNMLMDILDKSFVTDVYHERDDRAFDNYLMKDDSTVEQLYGESKSPVFVIKTLCELERIPALHVLLSPVQVLWIYRDFRDVVNSMLKSFSNQQEQILRLAAGMDETWWENGLTAHSREVLKDYVTPTISAQDAVALQWYIRNHLFYELNLGAREETLLINYESLVTRPESGIRQVYKFCGLQFSPAVIRDIHPRSIKKQAAMAFTPEIEALCYSLLNKLDGDCRPTPNRSQQETG